MAKKKKTSLVKKKKSRKKTEFRLKEYVIGKLRSATRGHPRFTEAKENAKVNVKVVYNEDDMSAAVYPEKGRPFKVKLYKKIQNRERVMFKCASCGRLFFDFMYLPSKKKRLKKTKMIAIDHVYPIVAIDGFTTWDTYIDRLFNGELQILCNYPNEMDNKKSCHSIKTAAEKKIRQEKDKIQKEKK